MPDPRPLGNVAKSVLSKVAEALEESQSEYFEVVLHAHAGDAAEVVKALKELSSRNYFALVAINNLLADRPKEAEEAIIRAKLRRKE